MADLNNKFFPDPPVKRDMTFGERATALANRILAEQRAGTLTEQRLPDLAEEFLAMLDQVEDRRIIDQLARFTARFIVRGPRNSP